MTAEMKSALEGRLAEIESTQQGLWSEFTKAEAAAKPHMTAMEHARMKWCAVHQEVEWLKKQLSA